MPDTHITIPMARLIELETAEQERDIFRSERLDLALLVGRLIPKPLRNPATARPVGRFV